MKWPTLPTGPDKPSWPGLWGAAPMLYLFWDPLHKGASTAEWLWTILAFTIFLVFAVLGAIYWSRPHIMRAVCAGIVILAGAFTTYRPNGIFIFIYAGAYAPLATRGEFAATGVVLMSLIALMIVQWLLLWPPSWTPYIVAAQTVVICGAITGVVRQQTGLRQILKTAERERIARDLHDILGHTLSVIILKSELAHRLMEHDPKRAKTEMEDVERISRRALAEVREAIAGYRGTSLTAEIDRAKATLESAGITVEKDCGSVTLPASHETVLGLVLRESVTNIIRHAHARHCRLTLRQKGEDCWLEIHDDGHGGMHVEGNGMRGIRERVAAIGGQVSWRSEQGTTVVISAPLRAATNGAAA